MGGLIVSRPPWTSTGTSPAGLRAWARFHEIGTTRPIFSDRDGVTKLCLAEIGYERYNGYAWLGDWSQKLLEKEHPALKRKWVGKP